MEQERGMGTEREKGQEMRREQKRGQERERGRKENARERERGCKRGRERRRERGWNVTCSRSSSGRGVEYLCSRHMKGKIRTSKHTCSNNKVVVSIVQ
jgi:hypothetical protein